MDFLLEYWILCIARTVLNLLDLIFDALLGVTFQAGSTRESRLATKSYHHSAQIAKIIWRAKPHVKKETRLCNFLYKHEEYVSPDVILEQENVTLMAVERDYALFAMSDPGVDIYDPTKFPFVFISQYLEAKKLVVVPIESFHKLAEKVGDPKVPVIFMGTTHRSGSTLLVQMFNRVPGTRPMSEPSATKNIHDLRVDGYISAKESLVFLKSAIRLHCKVEPSSGVQRIFFKAHLIHGVQVGDIHKLFPCFKFVFNTRHPLASLNSASQMIAPFTKRLYYRLGIYWRELAKEDFALSYDPKRKNSMANSYSRCMPNVRAEILGIMSYSLSLLGFFDHKDVFGGYVLYEELIKHPETVLSSLFETLEISLEHVPLALEALCRDSKKDKAFKPSVNKPLDAEVLQTFDAYMKMLNLPIRHDTPLDKFRSLFA